MQGTTRADGVIHNARLCTLSAAEGYGLIEDGAVAWRHGMICYVGSGRDAPDATQRWNADGALVTPGLIDCHTHLVFAGDRAREFELRLGGASYQEIAAAGGGILSTVRATRAASDEALLAQSLPRALALRADGVTTVEIKSGYGLDAASEARMLRVARAIGRHGVIGVRTSFLGAHALPPEYAGRGDDYIDLLCGEILPALHAEGLVDAVDAFCEGIGFSPAQTRRLFEVARALGLPVKLHADQLSDLGGAGLVAEYGGLSADHVEYSNIDSVAAMAAAGTVAVLLPGAFYALRETRLPPIAAFLEHGVPLAVATDLNPGTSPLTSLRLAMSMACTLFRLTPLQALRGTTVNAARALGLTDRGQLRAGLRADLVQWQAQDPAELSYWIGGLPPRRVLIGGESVFNS